MYVTKQITGGYTSNDTFTFEVKIAKEGESLDSVTPRIVKLKANQTWKSAYYSWGVTEDAPKYSVKEIELPKNAKLESVHTTMIEKERFWL